MDLIPALQEALARLPPGAIAVAFSGGMDSSALLHALAHTSAARARGMRAVHVDHGLHADSGAWARQCRDFAATLDVTFVALDARVHRGPGTGPEDAARRARYAAFAAQLHDGETLALAQHRDDQAETVLLKLLRGAGPEGLGGMRALRPFANGRLWRPLLDLPRTAIADYAQAHDLRWLEDPSNVDTRLRRNFLRAEILPRLTRRWPDATTALAHSATWARAAADFISDQANLALARLRDADTTRLDWRGWLALPDALRDPVLRLWLRELGLDEPAHFHIAELERQLRAPPDRAPCLGFSQTELRRYRSHLHAMRPLPPLPDRWEVRWRGEPLNLPGGGTLMIEGAHLPIELTVRYRRGGERLRPTGAAHSRELRLLLQEAGFPPWRRALIPLIYASAELLAVGDVLLSEAGARWCAAHQARFVLSPHPQAAP
jgi:tRNA(Ile)-lysidine synthase